MQKNTRTQRYIHYATSNIDEVFSELKTSFSGISDKEAHKRLKLYGKNEPAKKKKTPIFFQILSKFLNPLIVILIIIVGFSLFFGEKISAIIVLIMILTSVIIDFTQEYRSGKAVEKLNEMVRTRVTVSRNGKEREITIQELVPGDIIDLFAGDMIPADLRIIKGKDLFINQASLTGESFPVEKYPHKVESKNDSIVELLNIAFMGSSVVSGTGYGVVIMTGADTQFGEISKILSEKRAESSFDKGIRQFTMLMIRFVILLVISILFIILFFKHGSFKDALLFSLAVAVGLTPEMLPMIVTINLSKGALSMARKKVIVKKLQAIQNFGAMDVLCTDKTGTLTLDKIVLEKHCDIKGKEDDEVLKFAYINSLYQTGLKNVMDRAILKHEKILVGNYKKVDEMPFDFSRKIMSVVVEAGSRHIIITKGAPEEIFKRVNRYEYNGRTHRVTEKIFADIIKEYDKLSQEGFRVLAIAYREIRKKKPFYLKDDEQELILKGYVAFLDPAKPTVKKALSSLKDLGIEVKILTGDNELVTRKICSDVGLHIKGISTGLQIDNLDEIELQEQVEKTTIFARVSPLQKERIIKALQRNRHVVGYLGDGINDAPSLKTSDVGVSVNNAVDIAKESANIILLEKSLLVLEDGVKEGRKVFGNIVKYLKMGASSNLGNMISMTAATLFIPFLPMLPIQILLNNFLYDLSQVSIPADDVDKDYIKEPRPWNVEFIKKFMIFIGPLSSLFDFITFAVMWFIFYGYTQTPIAQSIFRTGWFIESICTQMLVIYIIRTNKIPFIQSRPSRYLVLTTLVFLFTAFSIPFSPLSHFFGFVALPLSYFGILAGIVISYLFVVQIVKSLVVKKYGFQ
jgi:Mg2+-importing ATPase